MSNAALDLLGAMAGPPSKGKGSTVTPPPVKQGPPAPPPPPPPVGSTPAQRAQATAAQTHAQHAGQVAVDRAKAALAKNAANASAKKALAAGQTALAAASKVQIVGEAIGEFNLPAGGVMVETRIQQMLTATIAAAAAAEAADAANNAITDGGASIYPSLFNLTVGGPAQQAILFVSGARSSSAAWTSSAPGVANVDASGNVVAVGPGSATITASQAGQTATATVNVSPSSQQQSPSSGGDSGGGGYGGGEDDGGGMDANDQGVPSFSPEDLSSIDQRGGGGGGGGGAQDVDLSSVASPDDDGNDLESMTDDMMGIDWLNMASGLAGGLSGGLIPGMGGKKDDGQAAALAEAKRKQEEAEKAAATTRTYLIVGGAAVAVLAIVFLRGKK